MDVAELVPQEFIPSLTWLGKQDWVNYRMDPVEKHTVFQAPVIRLAEAPQHLCPVLVQIDQLLSRSPADQLAYYAISKALALGPKLLRVTHEQCLALEQVDVNVPFCEYQQPYPAVFVELPSDYRKELSSRFAFQSPRYLLSYHDPRTNYLIATAFAGAGFSSIVNVLPPRPEYSTVEQALRKQADSGNDIDLAEVAQRVALNACLMLTHLGVKKIGIDNAGKLKKLAKSARSKNRRKAEMARAKLVVHPTLIGFQQEITFFRTEDQGKPGGGQDGNRANENLPRKPHWRRGHFRHQRVGAGRTTSKLVFIKPVLVNRRWFAGDEKDTQVTYSPKKQEDSPDS